MTAQFTSGFALLVAVDENSVARWALPDVIKDVAALQQVLVHPARCAFSSENVKVIQGKAATRQGILNGFDWLQQKLAADTSSNATAVVYYTGHGWRDETVQPPVYYLIPYDVRQDVIRSRSLRAEDFADAVAALQPKRLLIVLDCCHSSGMGVKELEIGIRGFVSAAMPKELLMVDTFSTMPAQGAKGIETLIKGAGRAVLSSSQADQRSYVRRDGQMSIFTYHLIEALTGHAQPQEGATEVLVSDVMSHVWRRVPASALADWSEPQEPDYQVTGNFPVALLLGGKGLSKGEKAPKPLELERGKMHRAIQISRPVAATMWVGIR